jgi:hypothetical protein
MDDYISREAVIRAADIYNWGKPCATTIKAINRIPAAEVKPVRWIPVEEQLPEAFKPVIVCRKGKDGSNRVEQGMLDVNGWWKVYGTRTKAVKHWMPLPEPPSVNGKETEHDPEREG